MRPLVGIPCQADFREGSGRPIYCNNRAYAHAVEDAGGIPVFIPMLNDISVLEALLSRLDGLLLSGGGDVDSVRYNEDARPMLGGVDSRLDELEFTLVQWALQADMPILGVCRGMQLLNVAFGGSLYQDLGEEYPGVIEHCRRELPRNTLIHNVNVASGSRMEKILGTNELWINSLHHQGIKASGANVYVSGRAEDGVAELLEVADYSFVMGIQGHPEEIYTQEAACTQLFSAFITACAKSHSNTTFIIEKLPIEDSLKLGA